MPIRLRAAVATVASLACVVPAQGFTQLTSPLGVPSIPVTTGNYGTGQCVADFDGDGDVDVIIAPAAGGAFAMFRNQGGMVFQDVSAAAGLGTHPQVVCMQNADVDNDGDQDVYVGGAFEPARLYINNGAGVFTEQAALRGLTRSDDNYSVSFGDYDRDGWLDLAVSNYFAPGGWALGQNRVYRNTGGGYFTDVTAAIGFGPARPTFCLAWMDFDEDMWPDLIEVNDKGAITGPNELYRNNGNGTFTAVGAQYAANNGVDGMCIDYADVFNDGGIDFFVADEPPDHLFNEWNPTLGTYVDTTAAHGLQGGGVGWCSYFFDYDNDAWFDLAVVHADTPNLLLRNPGASGAWTDMAPALGLDLAWQQFTMSIADFDNDGDIDILHRFGSSIFHLAPVGAAMFRNDLGLSNWLKFDLRGTTSNRDGFGARVEVYAGGKTIRQHCRNGVGYLSSSDKRVHFGLGPATQADRVTIYWPSGQVQYLTDVAARQIIEVVEPRMITAGTVAVGGSTTVTASIPGDEGLPYLMPLSLGVSNGIPLPDGRVFPLDQDSVLDFTVDPFNTIFVGSFGVLNAQGRGTATFNVPPLPWLSGLTVYSAALTLDAPTFPLIRTIVSEPASITIQ